MSLLQELSIYTPPLVEQPEVSSFDLLMEQIEELLEADEVTKDDNSRPGKISMSKMTTVMLSASDDFNLKDKVFGLRIDTPAGEYLLGILGVPRDGSPIQIRTGYMRYVSNNKMLFIAKFKSDLPK